MVALLKKIQQSQVFMNFSYLTLGGVISQGLGLITFIKIADIFSPDNYGLYTFLLVQGQLIITVGDLGIRNVFIRSIARDRFKTMGLLRAGATLKIVAIVVLSFLYLAYNAIWGHLSIGEVMLIIVFGVFNCLTNLFESVFLGNQKMLPISVFNITTNTIWCAIVFLLPEDKIDVELLFSIYIVINVAKAIGMFLYLKLKDFLVGAARDIINTSKSLMKESWPFFSLALLMLPINYFSNNFLDINSTQEELGYFNLAQKLTLPITLLMGFALSAIFPNFSSLWAKDKDKFYRIITAGMKYFMLVTLILTFLFTLFARELVEILFNEGYLPAIKVCQLQIWFVFLMSINNLIGTIWASTNKEKLILKTAVINAIISIPALFWGSKFGALGLSYGYVISFAISEIYIWIVFIRSENIKIKGATIIWIFASLLFIISYFLPQDISLLYRMAIALLVTAGISFYLYKKKQLYRLS